MKRILLYGYAGLGGRVRLTGLSRLVRLTWLSGMVRRVRLVWLGGLTGLSRLVRRIRLTGLSRLVRLTWLSGIVRRVRLILHGGLVVLFGLMVEPAKAQSIGRTDLPPLYSLDSFDRSERLNPVERVNPFVQDPGRRSRYRPEHIQWPMREGKIFFSYISLMDSSLSKEKIYRAAINWYYKTFPYGRKNILEDGLKEGRILARGEFIFSYHWLFEEYKMKVGFLLDIQFKYGKYRIVCTDLEPQDQIHDENEYGHSFTRFEPRDIQLMYQQYLQMHPPFGFAKDKIEQIDAHCREMLTSFSQQMNRWTKPPAAADF